MCVRNRARAAVVLRLPLMSAGRALGQLPFVAEQVLEEFVAPQCGCAGPGNFEAAGDGISSVARTEGALPSEALVLDVTTLWIRTDMRSRACAMGLAEGVSTGNQRNCLFVVHGHATKGFANVAGRGNGIRLAVRALRIDIDQTHLNRTQRLGQLALARVAGVGTQPFPLGAP